MLIENNKFNLKEFKKIYKSMNWKKVCRKTGSSMDFFYIGILDNENKKIKVKIRPSMRMMVEETGKNFDKNGIALKENYDGIKYEFGTTIEVLINEKFLSQIQKLCKDTNENNIEKVNW